ncbi:acetylglucosamine-6-sulfatase [Aureibaculum algae]|uniref:Acetylglucosamine-6-sulfatase n=1 Tax=Aureibaculum algae TaxID=2584122 RepID=A0A5B7TYS4_9FLAO|nr:sulfatase-like hydrolase/transferase [Aureibaculum algae]QCX40326.1 acetylglucosamine-6-sulfatase [Aureibaculum algae]
MEKLKHILYVIFFAIYAFANAQEKPNIVFILTDDQSYNMLGCTGNSIVQTPNIDKLAKEGVLFTNAHITSAICTPSRTSILLGQFERKHAVNFNSGTSVSDEAWQNSFPMLMRSAGYYTGWIGKNHVPIGKGGYESGVMEKSFDYWYAGHGHLGFYPKEIHEIFNDAIADTQVEVIQEGVDDFIDSNARKLKGAIHFLEKRPDNKPFLLSINFNLPHGASTSTMKMKPTDDAIYKTMYRDMEIPLPEGYIAKAAIKTPKLPADLLRAEDRQSGYNYIDTPQAQKERYIRQLEAMTGIDRLVGKLQKKLHDLKLDNNTIIIFTSDHGLFMGEQGLGGKALCYEKTTHVPIIILDPRLKKKSRGFVSNALVQTIDLAPTMLTYGGVSLPNSFQGKSIINLVEGKKEEPRTYLLTENLWSTQFGNPRCEAVQDKEWKYIRYYKNNTISASKKIKVAKQFGIPINKMLYVVHDIDLVTYRDFVESPLQGEQPVYEELYHLKTDPQEFDNVIEDSKNEAVLNRLKSAWKTEITKARGTEAPKVYRYTAESQLESNMIIEPK